MSRRYLIVGAGVFGLSTAYHLLLDGEKDVLVIDKADVIPAPDASSNDINRIVRTAYGNPMYTRLAKEAIARWKSDFPGIYHESGVLVLGDTGYATSAKQNDEAAGELVSSTEGTEALRSRFPQLKLGDFEGCTGYLNASNGWADAEGGMKALLQKVLELGGTVTGGKTVASILLNEDGAAKGVQLQGGEDILSDVVVVAAGAWTPALVAQSSLAEVASNVVASGQCVAAVQLSEEEASRYKDVPVILNFSTGFYVFPPNRDRLLKMAIHDRGYTWVGETGSTVSRPRTSLSHGPAGLAITRVKAEKLRNGLKAAYPEFGDRPFAKTRLCWYADTQDGDWLIDQHPRAPGLFFATAGNGHAYKFLPILGELVVQRIKGTLPSAEATTFAFNRTFAPHRDPDRVLRLPDALQDDPSTWYTLDSIISNESKA